MKTKMLILLMAVVMAGWFAGCTEEGTTPEETPTAAPTVTCTPCPAQTPCPECPEVPAGAVDCGACHAEATDYVAHVKGGRTDAPGRNCFSCHTSDVHGIHVGEGTIQLNCDVCHVGSAGTFEKPTAEPPDTTCEQCHDPVNPVEPSNGNLVTIHLGRDRPCTVCHTEDLNVVHPTADSGVQE